MNISNVMREVRLRRVVLERKALQMVCACMYYDLADCIDEASEQELINIINRNYDCEICGLKRSISHE